MSTDCLFCRIASGAVPAHIIFQDEQTLAFLDINPRSLGHTMVISRFHSATLLDLPDEHVAPLFLSVKKVTSLLAKAFHPDGFTMGINHGSVSGQTVEHLHFHIIPRWHNDKGSSLHSVVNNPSPKKLEEVAQAIKHIS